MTATEIEVGKRFRFRGLLLKCKHPNQSSIGQKAWLGGWGTPNREQDYSSPGPWHSLTQRSTCPAWQGSIGERSPGTACQCKWEAQGSSYVYHLPFPAITKQSAFISARLNQTQVKSREREAKASQVSSFVLACREIERALFDLPQRQRELRSKPRNPLNNSGNNFITLVTGIYINTKKKNTLIKKTNRNEISPLKNISSANERLFSHFWTK